MLFLSLLGCFGSSSPSNSEVSEGPRPDIVLVTLDTTRADRLGCYGYEKGDTPVLDALCNSGRRYARAYSPIPLTIPSHAALFTGIQPARLGIRDNGDGKLEEDQITLAEILKEEGYQTAAAVTAFVTTRTWGFDQGFDAFFDTIERRQKDSVWQAERRGGEALDELLEWAEERDPTVPSFSWLHLYDPHFPYAPPDEYWEDWKERPYDGELAYVDDLMGRLTAEFDPSKTLFVIVADHGEGLGDHQELTHGLYVYDSTQHIPFFISGPGVKPEVVNEPVGLADVLPTVLSLLEIEPPEGIDGQVMPGNPARPIYMESWALMRRFGFSPHVAVVDGDHKLINTTQPELYNLIQDPGEVSLLEDSEKIKELQAMLADFRYEKPGTDRAAQDPATAMQLQALGYVDGSFVGDLDGELPDAKDYLEDILNSQKADHAVRDGDFARAESLLRVLVQRFPDALEFSNRLAAALSRQGKSEEASATLLQAAERAPDDPSLMAALGVHYARTGEYSKASGLFRRAADAMPWAPGLRAMAVASQLSVSGGQEEAIRLGLAYLEDFPRDYAVAGLVGVAFAKAQIVEARELLEVGIRAERPEAEVAFYLGLAELGEGKKKRARQLFRKELEHYPRHLMSAVSLIRIEGEFKRNEAVLEAASAALVHHPSDLNLLLAKAQASFNLKDFSSSRLAMDLALLHHSTSSEVLLLDANLLSKEGKPEEGRKRYEEAQAARRLEQEKELQGSVSP